MIVRKIRFVGMLGFLILLLLALPQSSLTPDAHSAAPVRYGHTCGNSEAWDPRAAREEICGYSGIGRIKWRLPPGSNYGIAVPDFTAGPRILCDPKGPESCEITVDPRDLAEDPEERRNRFFRKMQTSLAQAVEQSVQVRSHGAATPVLYATLTDKRSKEALEADSRREGKREYRHVTIGLHVKGPAVITFEHFSADSTGKELRRLLDMVHSAEPLDGLVVLPLKLVRYKAVCEERFPKFKIENNAAFSASIFATVNPAQLLQSVLPGSLSPEEIAAELEQGKVIFARAFDQKTAQQQETFCRVIPKQIAEAESAMQLK